TPSLTVSSAASVYGGPILKSPSARGPEGASPAGARFQAQTKRGRATTQAKRTLVFILSPHFFSAKAYRCLPVRIYKTFSAIAGVAATRSPSFGLRAITSGLAE